ncbi:hypothetical protein [Ferrimonas marina]|uniref:Uncharacterized protein n=1 Tax=Ferrimonas marina TaxID=299255 RepID=A0A1M5X3Q1_9GAMM|nr:hypothetical protein [Ferrimonas marina]SHH94222.1 hypothetical protein SAMN02745129_3184 [Ferrimonas marina]
MSPKVLNTLKWTHRAGLVFLAIGLALYAVSPAEHDVGRMVVMASCLGLGLVLIAPWPIALFLRWAQSQSPGN